MFVTVWFLFLFNRRTFGYFPFGFVQFHLIARLINVERCNEHSTDFFTFCQVIENVKSIKVRNKKTWLTKQPLVFIFSLRRRRKWINRQSISDLTIRKCRGYTTIIMRKICFKMDANFLVRIQCIILLQAIIQTSCRSFS